VVRAFLGRQDGAWVRESGRAPRSRGHEAGEEVAQRLSVVLEREQALIEGVDASFRFHSGVPA